MKKGKLKYYYAEDNEENLVHIDDASPGEKYRHLYSHEPMIVKNGKNRRKHFALDKGVVTNEDGNNESYFHELGKRLFKERFYSKNPLEVKYFVYPKCENLNKCEINKRLSNLKCGKPYYCTMVLNEEYDTCEIEKYHEGFIGDLLISDSRHSDKPPVFIEFCNTNPCSEEKKTSGFQIIEIKIGDDQFFPESIVEQFPNNEFKIDLTKENNPYLPQDLPNIRFYGFDRRRYPKMGRFSVYKTENGEIETKYEVSEDTCKTENIKPLENSLFEISMAHEIVTSVSYPWLIDAMFAVAKKNGMDIKTCKFCFYGLRCDFSCQRKKNQGAEKICSNYFYWSKEVEKLVKSIGSFPYKSWVRKSIG